MLTPAQQARTAAWQAEQNARGRKVAALVDHLRSEAADLDVEPLSITPAPHAEYAWRCIAAAAGVALPSTETRAAVRRRLEHDAAVTDPFEGL